MGKKVKKVKKVKKPEQPKTFDVSLPSGQTVNITITKTKEKIDRPVVVVEGVNGDGSPRYRKFRDKNGTVVTSPVLVNGLRVRVRYSDGMEVEARSCCKPPDTFVTRTAVAKAVHRIYKSDSGLSLDKYQKGGKPIHDEAVQRRLNGLDRKALFQAAIRLGKPKPEPKLVEQSKAV